MNPLPILSIILWLAVPAIVLVASIINATLIYDDLYLVEHFTRLTEHHGILPSLKILFFNLDLGAREYRLYGLSKILHYSLWGVAGAHAWVYAIWIAVSQLATGWAIRCIFLRFNSSVGTATLLALAWILSPFIVTTCFHHYSYLILPCQIIILGALLAMRSLATEAHHPLLLQSFLFPIGLAIAWTGESHLILAIGVLAAIAGLAPGHHAHWAHWSRIRTLLIPLAAICIGVIFHRLMWTHWVADSSAGTTRFTLATPDITNIIDRSRDMLISLPRGIWAQIKPLLKSVSPIIMAIPFVLALGFVLFPPQRITASTLGSTKSKDLSIALGLTGCLLASLSVIWALVVLSGQVSHTLPRRYGYVPYTLALMLTIAILAGNWIRQRLGNWPWILVGTSILVLWGILHAYVLPKARHQEVRLWQKIATALNENNGPRHLLFLNAWNHPGRREFSLSVGTPTLRGPDCPEILESPLSAFWWQAQYARVLLRSKFVGYRISDEKNGLLRLYGNGLQENDSVVIPASSLVTVGDPNIEPPSWREGPTRAVIYASYAEFAASPLALACGINRGWPEVMEPMPIDSFTIKCGAVAIRLPEGIFPDKHFGAPSVMPAGIIDYGIESGDDRIYTTAGWPHLSYFTSNRHGSFIYRIDFQTTTARDIHLDFLESWHTRPGIRPMKLEWWTGNTWASLAIIDPFLLGGKSPVSFRFRCQVSSLRIRLSSAPGAQDIPFVNGIRISPTSPTGSVVD